MNRTPDVSLSGPRTLGRLGIPLLLYVATVLVYLLHGTGGQLMHDHALYVWMGQELVAGRPPYLSVFDHKGPLAPLLCGLGVWLGRGLGMDDLEAVRLLHLVLCSTAVVGIYGLALTLFRSPWQAVLTALLFLAYRKFGLQVVSGPMPKTLSTTFVVFCLLAAANRRWFLAGIAASLAALVWQVTGLFSLGVLLLSCTQSREGARGRGLLAAALGIGLPLLATTLYFVLAGAFDPFLQGFVLFNLQYVESTGSLYSVFGFLVSSILIAFEGVGLLGALGLAACFLMLPWRLRRFGGWRGLLAGDPFALLLLTLPPLCVWSLIDFQGYPDIFFLLPYAVLGMGWILAAALNALATELELGQAGRRRARLGLSLLVLFCAVFLYRYQRPKDELAREKQRLAEIVAEAGPEPEILSIGGPEVMVLEHGPSRTPFAFLLRGVPNYIEAKFPGGFEGWLDSLPDVDLLIVNTVSRPLLDEAKGRAFDAWLEDYEVFDSYRTLDFLLPRDRAATRGPAGAGSDT